MADGLATLADPDTCRAFLHTARSILDPGGQRVDATDRLYLAAGVPVLILWGARDPMIPVEHGRRAHELMPHSRLEVFDDAGHFPFRDEPLRFVRVLQDFIATTEPATRRGIDALVAQRPTARRGCAAMSAARRGRALHERLGQPRLRGVSHVVAAWVAALVAAALIVLAPRRHARASPPSSTALGLCALFAGSGTLPPLALGPALAPAAAAHRPQHDLRLHRGELHADRAARAARHDAGVVLAGVWAGALAGVLLSVAWIDAPRWLGAATYLALGWVALLAVPQLLAALPAVAARAAARRRRCSTRPAPSSTRASARTRGRRRSASTSSSTRS